MSRRRPDDRGTVITEVAIVVPIAIALLCVIALVGRMTTARQTVDGAARDAARTASLQRNPDQAWHTAQTSADRSLDAQNLSCASTTVVVDTAAFAPGGQVTVTVDCEVELSDLGLLGLRGTRRITATATSVVDTYRGLR